MFSIKSFASSEMCPHSSSSSYLQKLTIKNEITLFDTFYNFLIVLPIKGRVAAEEDISQNTAAPDITLVVIVLQKDFRGYVIRLDGSVRGLTHGS